mmetsp:Transcript_22259/g.68619  ORF Transcript_22259/g.68619 Transcript_22259/m.68619 type:complete len:251 (+) Transcript_22259:2430-3182(+)
MQYRLPFLSGRLCPKCVPADHGLAFGLGLGWRRSHIEHRLRSSDPARAWAWGEAQAQAQAQAWAWAIDVSVGMSTRVVSRQLTREAYALAVGQAAHFTPVNLRIAEARPAVLVTLLHECVERAAQGRHEEALARDAVVELHRQLRLPRLHEEPRLRPVARLLGEVPVVAADAVRGLAVRAPTQVLLHRGIRGAVGLLAHNILAADDGVGGALRSWIRRRHAARIALDALRVLRRLAQLLSHGLQGFGFGF